MEHPQVSLVLALLTLEAVVAVFRVATRPKVLVALAAGEAGGEVALTKQRLLERLTLEAEVAEALRLLAQPHQEQQAAPALLS